MIVEQTLPDQRSDLHGTVICLPVKDDVVPDVVCSLNDGNELVELMVKVDFGFETWDVSPRRMRKGGEPTAAMFSSNGTAVVQVPTSPCGSGG